MRGDSSGGRGKEKPEPLARDVPEPAAAETAAGLEAPQVRLSFVDILTEPDLREDFELRGKRKAREYTWKECAKHTLLAYQAAQDQGQDEPKLGGLF